MQKRYLSNIEIKETVENGWRLFKYGQTVLAYDQFEKILNAAESRKYPEIWSEAMAGLGMIFKERKRFREAKTCFKKAYGKNSQKITYLLEYGDACKYMRWHSEAIAAWEKCLEYEKNDIQLLVRIAESYDMLGNFVMAKNYYLQACEIEPENKHVLMGLGSLYFHNYLYLDAIYYWDKLVLNKQFTDATILLRLGHCYRKRKEYEKAVEYYKQALSIDENNSYGLYGLVKSYKELNNKEQERFYYEKLLFSEPQFNDLIALLAGYYKKDRKHETVIKFFKEESKKNGPCLALFDLALKEKGKGNLMGSSDILEFLFYSGKLETGLKERVIAELSIQAK